MDCLHWCNGHGSVPEHWNALLFNMLGPLLGKGAGEGAGAGEGQGAGRRLRALLWGEGEEGGRAGRGGPPAAVLLGRGRRTLLDAAGGSSLGPFLGRDRGEGSGAAAAAGEGEERGGGGAGERGRGWWRLVLRRDDGGRR